MKKNGKSQEAIATMINITPEWLQRTAEAIVSRHGVQLTDCVTQAENGEVVQLLYTTILENIGSAVDNIRRTLRDEVELKAEQIEKQQQQIKNSGRRESRSDQAENAKERQLYVEVMVRVAITGALARYQLLISKNNQREKDECGGNNKNNNSECISNKPPQKYFDTLARGLLHAFEVFQEVHSMNRSHYPKRQGDNTVGTVGWDTLLLLHFVHGIPRVAREASEHVIDEATGQTVRSWRKLLQSLQTADPQESPKHSRRRGALAVCNGLLSILFNRYNTHQCRVLVNSVEQTEKIAESTKDWGKSILQPAQHMTAEVVNFCYYKGRLMLYDRRFGEAYESLREAYQLLPPPGTGTESQQRNKQRVRFYLSVAGIIHGKVVPDEVLETDDLIGYVFTPILNAIQRGDPHAFTKAIDAFSTLLRKRGVYFILQRAKLFCFLLLLARTHSALGACDGVDNSRIPLTVLTAAYTHVVEEGKKEAASTETILSTPRTQKKQRFEEEILEVDTITIDEMTLWTAKLIASGLVRGYISYEHKTIVLSRQTPFPTLAIPT